MILLRFLIGRITIPPGLDFYLPVSEDHLSRSRRSNWGVTFSHIT